MAAVSKARRTIAQIPGLIAILLAFSATPAPATFVPKVPIPDLWGYADCVIEAIVDSTNCSWDPTGNWVMTNVYLNVTVVHQGPCQAGQRILKLAGGTMGTVGMAIPLQPSFEAGEEVLLFLDESPGLMCPVIAMDQGKFTISPVSLTGEARLSNRLHSITRATMFNVLRPAPRNR